MDRYHEYMARTAQRELDEDWERVEQTRERVQREFEEELARAAYEVEEERNQGLLARLLGL